MVGPGEIVIQRHPTCLAGRWGATCNKGIHTRRYGKRTRVLGRLKKGVVPRPVDLPSGYGSAISRMAASEVQASNQILDIGGLDIIFQGFRAEARKHGRPPAVCQSLIAVGASYRTGGSQDFYCAFLVALVEENVRFIEKGEIREQWRIPHPGNYLFDC